MSSVNFNTTSANPANSWGLSFTNYMANVLVHSYTISITTLALKRLLGSASLVAGPAACLASPIVVPIALAAAPIVATVVVKTAEKAANCVQQTLVKREYRNLANTQELPEINPFDLPDEEDTVLVEIRTGVELGENEKASMVKAINENNFDIIDPANVREALEAACEIAENAHEILATQEILDGELPDLR